MVEEGWGDEGGNGEIYDHDLSCIWGVWRVAKLAIPRPSTVGAHSLHFNVHIVDNTFLRSWTRMVLSSFFATFQSVDPLSTARGYIYLYFSRSPKARTRWCTPPQRALTRAHHVRAQRTCGAPIGRLRSPGPLKGSLCGPPFVSFWVDFLSFFGGSWGCIWAVYPLQTNPFGPRLNQNLPTNRPEVLAKYGVSFGYPSAVTSD